MSRSPASARGPQRQEETGSELPQGRGVQVRPWARLSTYLRRNPEYQHLPSRPANPAMAAGGQGRDCRAGRRA